MRTEDSVGLYELLLLGLLIVGLVLAISVSTLSYLYERAKERWKWLPGAQ